MKTIIDPIKQLKVEFAAREETLVAELKYERAANRKLHELYEEKKSVDTIKGFLYGLFVVTIGSFFGNILGISLLYWLSTIGQPTPTTKTNGSLTVTLGINTAFLEVPCAEISETLNLISTSSLTDVLENGENCTPINDYNAQ